jgi:hypothetical protein
MASWAAISSESRKCHLSASADGRQRKTATRAKAVESEARTSKAVEYAKRGYSNAEIGQVLGISKTGAWQLVRGALTAAAAQRQKAAVAMLQLEVERVEAMMRPVARPAMGGETGDTFDPTVIDKMIAQHKTKLLGLNAPTRSEKAVFGKRGEPPVGITDDGAAEQFFR